MEVQLEGRRLRISSAIFLLNEIQRIVVLRKASAIRTSVEVFAAPASALISRLSVEFVAASTIAACSGVGANECIDFFSQLGCLF